VQLEQEKQKKNRIFSLENKDNRGTILVVDDDLSVRELIKNFLEKNSYRVLISENWIKAEPLILKNKIDIILLDINLPFKSGIEVLKENKDRFLDTKVIIFSGKNDIELAVEAIKLGAFDYVQKTDSIEKILKVIDNALKLKVLEEENKILKKNLAPLKYIKGISKFSEEIDKLIKTAARTDATVLITGENGTGKQVVAETIHSMSLRKHGPFIDINCAAIPETLLESELFGYKKGAFTGAYQDTKGKFEAASGGTIFLDEISEIPISLQAKLLKVIENKEFTPLGSTQVKKLNARIIAATNKNLEEEISNGKFRQDLFYRLNVINISLLPLRERRDDIPILLERFINSSGKDIKLSKDAIQILIEYDWPGNIRELKNFVERCTVMSESELITKDDVIKFLNLRKNNIFLSIPNCHNIMPLKEFLECKEKEYLEFIVSRYKYKKEIARILNIERTALYRKLKKYNIQ